MEAPDARRVLTILCPACGSQHEVVPTSLGRFVDCELLPHGYFLNLSELNSLDTEEMFDDTQA